MFGDFGGAGTGEESKKVEDTAGRKWDLGVPGMFRFEIVQVQGAKHDGIKMKRLQAYCDNAPLIAEMGKRGIVKSDDTLVSKK